MANRHEPANDRRVEKTRRSLLDALHALIREKDFDAIAVKEILDRANVGRSTFYLHFRDKDDLLASGIDELLAAPPPPVRPGQPRAARMLWFSLPLLEFLERQRGGQMRKVGAHGRAVLHERLREVLAERIGEGFARVLRRRSDAAVAIPDEVMVGFLATTFVEVLNWWLGSGSALPATGIDRMYRELVMPALAAGWE